MKSNFEVGDVVQFLENHKWCGCLGIVNEVMSCGEDNKLLIGVPIPEQGTAFIFSMESKNECEYIGKAVMVTPGDDEEEDDG